MLNIKKKSSTQSFPLERAERDMCTHSQQQTRHRKEYQNVLFVWELWLNKNMFSKRQDYFVACIHTSKHEGHISIVVNIFKLGRNYVN